MTTEVEHFGQMVGETARAWRLALDRRLQPLGLSQARWLVLLHLARAEQPLTQKELAARIGIESSTLVGQLDRMARDGWVERRPTAADRRCKQVHLTARAHHVIGRIETAAAALRAELYRGLSEAELRRCMRLLTRIKQRAEQA